MKSGGAAVIPTVVSLIILHTRAVLTVEPFSTLGPLIRCEEKWLISFYFKGYCYEVVDAPMTWKFGKYYCKSNNSSLVSIHSDEEVLFLRNLLSANRYVSGNRVWIGLSARNDYGILSWSDNSRLDFTYWDDNEPNGENNKEECVSMYTGHGKWNDEHCDTSMGSICKRYKDAVVSVDVTTIGKCKTGWYPANGRCYLPVGYSWEDQEKWIDGEEKCRRSGGHLVSIHNEREQAFLSNLAEDLTGDVWIGIRNTFQSNEYNWVDDSRKQYTNWASGQPLRSFGDQRFCVKMVENGKWQVERCSKKLSYICYMQQDLYVNSEKRENFSHDSHHRNISLALILVTVLLVLFILVGMAIISYYRFNHRNIRNHFRLRRNRQQNTLFTVESSMIEYQEGFANDSR